MSFAYADRLEPRTGAVFSPATNVDRAALRGLEFLRRPIPPGARGAKAGTSGARPTMSLENVAPLNPATTKREVCEVGRAPPSGTAPPSRAPRAAAALSPRRDGSANARAPAPPPAAGVCPPPAARRSRYEPPPPARFALATLAATTRADLIVVGSRGLTGLKRGVMRSTSTYLIENASCPCLVYREPPVSEPFEMDG